MKILLGCFLSGLLALTLRANETDRDLIVYGGTPSGLIAAVAAAREGLTVTVLEPSRWIGGMVTGGLSKSDIGKPETIGGYTREFFTQAAKDNDPKFLWYAEPYRNMEAFRALLTEAKVEVITHVGLKSVQREGQRLSRLTTLDGRIFRGRQFIDATYEGDLMAAAGVSFIIGRESRTQYGERLAGYFPMPIRPRSEEVMSNDCPSIGGKGPSYIHGTPTDISGLDSKGQPIAGVNVAPPLQPGDADQLTQSYNFRICVTQRPDLKLPFPKPAHYDAQRYELLLRLIQAHPAIPFGRLYHLGEIANGKYDLNAQGIFSTDYPGANTDYPGGDTTTRARILQEHLDHNQGLFWFLCHDARVPLKLREQANTWGLCKDEFTDNAGWPYALYVREARRMIGEYVLTQKDLQQEITKPDTVAMGSFLIDCHIVERILTPAGMVRDEGSFQDEPVKPYQIPYRCLTPKRNECENLLVTVCPSASHIAYCSLRMEPVYMALGQVAGVASALALHGHSSVQSIDVPVLQGKLRAQKAVLELKSAEAMRFTGIVIDDEEAAFTGTWVSSNFGKAINATSRHDGNDNKGKCEARFETQLPHEGRYHVRFAYLPSGNRASNVPVRVVAATGSQTFRINQKLTPELEGHFVELGVFDFIKDKPAQVIISNADTDGFVSVDAVQFVPAETEVIK
jgi:hypothetical protein